MRCLLFVHDGAGNALGRAHALWMLARDVGIDARLRVPGDVAPWAPARDEDEFAACFVGPGDPFERTADVYLAVKPMPGSLGSALRRSRETGVPVLADADEDDFVAAFGPTVRGGFVRAARLVKNRRPVIGHIRARRAWPDAAAWTVSNPALADAYGTEATLLPHPRRTRPAGREHGDRDVLSIAFVGTWRHYKGLEVLRRALVSLPGYELVATCPPPADARPNERWVGETTLADGLTIVDRADVVVVPSTDTPFTRTQLPMKLLDAMLSGRAVVASDLAPIRWAGGGSIELVEPGQPVALAEALGSLRSVERRRDLGDRARDHALRSFTTDALGEAFLAACDRATSTG